MSSKIIVYIGHLNPEILNMYLTVIYFPENNCSFNIYQDMVNEYRDQAKTSKSDIVFYSRSPIFLNHFDPEEVRVIRHSEVYHVPRTYGLNEALKTSKLGDVWLKFGEDFLIYGRRSKMIDAKVCMNCKQYTCFKKCYVGTDVTPKKPNDTCTWFTYFPGIKER